MKLHVENTKILAAGEAVQGTVDIDDALIPVDFLQTFSLGKYSVVDGKIIEDMSFVMPEPIDPMSMM